MSIHAGKFWDRLSLRWKGALIVSVPLVALLAWGLISYWFDREGDRRDELRDQAFAARELIEHLDDELSTAAGAFGRYTRTEDPSSLDAIDGDLLEDVRGLRAFRRVGTNEPYAGAEELSRDLERLVLRSTALTLRMSSRAEPTERQEDALDRMTDEMLLREDGLEDADDQAAADAELSARKLDALEEVEENAEIVMLVLGLLGGLASARFFAHNFTSRISELGTAAEHFAAGDFSRPFPQGSDEIGVLARRVHGAFSDLRESEERSRLILETSADAYTAVDDQWTVIAWNRAAETILGWTKEEAIGRKLLELVVPEAQRDAYVADLRTFLEHGDSEMINNRIETEALHKDGHLVPIDLSVMPIRAGGRLTFHSFVRDLTVSKKAEEDLAKRARRMAEIIETMSEMASAEMDVQLLHRLLLERARSLTNADGVALQLERKGKLRIVAGVGPVAAHVGRELDIATSMTGHTLTSGETLVTGDILRDHLVDGGLARDVGVRSAITVPLSDAGRVVGVLAVHSGRVDAFGGTEVTDLELLGGFFGAVIGKIQAYVAREVVVRERTQALRELRELHDELASKNDALVLATEEANAANHAKSEFLSRMSHELRTPLNAILGFAQLLQTEPLEPDQIDSLGHVERAGRHLLDLINEVLDIARIESGNTPLSLGCVDVRALAVETVDLIRPLAAQRGIEVTVSDASNGASAWADPQRVRQILLNLLSNGVKYNRVDGDVDVKLAEDGDRLWITVADTGGGIPDERLRSLFTPFDRLGAERTVVEGTGLGLAVSKKLAEAMGGDLRCETSEGSGSTFVLQLPKSEPGSPLTSEVSPPASRGAPARDHRRVLLYVEDNASNARLVERALERRPDLELHVAATGAAGLAAAERLRPSLVLLDMNLPDADGVRILEALRAAATTRATPILVLSANATGEQRRAALDAGAGGYLTKPVDLDELLRKIDSLSNAGVGAR